MAIHQIGLLSSKQGAIGRVNTGPLLDYVRLGGDLAEAIGLTEEVEQGLRRQALALLQSQRYPRALAVLQGLAALGNVHSVDPIIAARASQALGRSQAAAIYFQHAEKLLLSQGLAFGVEEDNALVPGVLAQIDLNHDELSSLLEEGDLESLGDIEDSWHDVRRLASAVYSYVDFLFRDQGSESQVLSETELSLCRLKQVTGAIKAAGVCEATTHFPQAALEETQNLVERQIRRLEAQDRAAGASTEVHRSTNRLDSFKAQLLKTPNYCILRSGYHHPVTAGGFSMESLYSTGEMLSEERSDFYLVELTSQGAQLPRVFLRAIGFDAAVLDSWQVKEEAIFKLLSHGALAPLRAFNETIQDMGPDQLLPQFRALVNEVVQAFVEDSFSAWRRQKGQKQLRSLSPEQRKAWCTSLRRKDSKTIEDWDDLRALWATRLEGGQQGFDRHPAEALALLSNLRYRVIGIQDQQGTLEAGAKLSLLEREQGSAVIVLDRSYFAHHLDAASQQKLSQRIVSHAIAKASRMGVELSVHASYREILSSGPQSFIEEGEGKYLYMPAVSPLEFSDSFSPAGEVWLGLQEVLMESSAQLLLQPKKVGAQS